MLKNKFFNFFILIILLVIISSFLFADNYSGIHINSYNYDYVSGVISGSVINNDLDYYLLIVFTENKDIDIIKKNISNKVYKNNLTNDFDLALLKNEFKDDNFFLFNLSEYKFSEKTQKEFNEGQILFFAFQYSENDPHYNYAGTKDEIINKYTKKTFKDQKRELKSKFLNKKYYRKKNFLFNEPNYNTSFRNIVYDVKKDQGYIDTINLENKFKKIYLNLDIDLLITDEQNHIINFKYALNTNNTIYLDVDNFNGSLYFNFNFNNINLNDYQISSNSHINNLIVVNNESTLEINSISEEMVNQNFTIYFNDKENSQNVFKLKIRKIIKNLNIQLPSLLNPELNCEEKSCSVNISSDKATKTIKIINYEDSSNALLDDYVYVFIDDITGLKDQKIFQDFFDPDLTKFSLFNENKFILDNLPLYAKIPVELLKENDGEITFINNSSQSYVIFIFRDKDNNNKLDFTGYVYSIDNKLKINNYPSENNFISSKNFELDYYVIENYQFLPSLNLFNFNLIDNYDININIKIKDKPLLDFLTLVDLDKLGYRDKIILNKIINNEIINNQDIKNSSFNDYIFEIATKMKMTEEEKAIFWVIVSKKTNFGSNFDDLFYLSDLQNINECKLLDYYISKYYSFRQIKTGFEKINCSSVDSKLEESYKLYDQLINLSNSNDQLQSIEVKLVLLASIFLSQRHNYLGGEYKNISTPYTTKIENNNKIYLDKPEKDTQKEINTALMSFYQLDVGIESYKEFSKGIPDDVRDAYEYNSEKNFTDGILNANSLLDVLDYLPFYLNYKENNFTINTFVSKFPNYTAQENKFENLSECPEGYVLVPGNSQYNTNDFCVMQYEARINNNLTLSTMDGDPISNITYKDAKNHCESIGANYHLVTNDEWMTIVRNIENVKENWVVEDDLLYLKKGNCSGYFSNDIKSDVFYTLSNGSEVFNLSDGLKEFVDKVIIDKTENDYFNLLYDSERLNKYPKLKTKTIADSKTYYIYPPKSLSAIPFSTTYSQTDSDGSYIYYLNFSDIDIMGDLLYNDFAPQKNNLTSENGVGMIFNYRNKFYNIDDGIEHVLLRGGSYIDDKNFCGIYSLSLTPNKNTKNKNIGFRCSAYLNSEFYNDDLDIYADKIVNHALSMVNKDIYPQLEEECNFNSDLDIEGNGLQLLVLKKMGLNNCNHEGIRKIFLEGSAIIPFYSGSKYEISTKNSEKYTLKYNYNFRDYYNKKELLKGDFLYLDTLNISAIYIGEKNSESEIVYVDPNTRIVKKSTIENLLYKKAKKNIYVLRIKNVNNYDVDSGLAVIDNCIEKREDNTNQVCTINTESDYFYG